MRLTIFDTETTDFPERGGELMQLGAIIVDASIPGRPIKVQSFMAMVKTDAPVSPGAFAAHGIAKEDSKLGIDPKPALQWFKNALSKCDLLVAHNLLFDLRVLSRMATLCGVEDMGMYKVDHYCTMQASKNLCALPNKNGYADFKLPKLEEALDILCGVKLDGAHDAAHDTDGCLRLLVELCNRGVGPAGLTLRNLRGYSRALDKIEG